MFRGYLESPSPVERGERRSFWLSAHQFGNRFAIVEQLHWPTREVVELLPVVEASKSGVWSACKDKALRAFNFSTGYCPCDGSAEEKWKPGQFSATITLFFLFSLVVIKLG